MKIYKSTIQQFLEEAKPPYYLSHSQMSMPSQVKGVAMHCDVVQLQGKNESGDWCEFFLQAPPVYSFNKEGAALTAKQAEAWAEEIRTRLIALNLELRNGRVADEPMVGSLE